MATAQEPLPVKLVISVLARHAGLLPLARTHLASAFGPVDHTGALMPFGHTRYYARELGDQPMRQFLAFERLIDPADLANIKLLTNALEATWSDRQGRSVNLDPGYLTLARLVLATTKDFAHRIYLAGGIYAEVALLYREGDFRPLPWTYPDYASEPCLAEMRAIRALYRSQLTSQRVRQGPTLRSG